MSKESWEARIIEAGYRELAKRYHPDHGGKNDDMAALNAAADMLRKFSPIAAVGKEVPAVQVNPAPGVILNIDVAKLVNTFTEIFGAKPPKRRRK